MNEDGWMDDGKLNNRLVRYCLEYGKKRSLFVVDSFRRHLTQPVKSKCQKQNPVIPGELTSVVQPLDVSMTLTVDVIRGWEAIYFITLRPLFTIVYGSWIMLNLVQPLIVFTATKECRC